MADDNGYTGINCKSAKTGTKDKKGRDMLSFSMDVENVEKLIEKLQTQKTERGAKMRFHLEMKVSESGRQFPSAFFYVDGIQDPASFNGQGRGGNRNFQRKDTTVDSGAATSVLGRPIE